MEKEETTTTATEVKDAETTTETKSEEQVKQEAQEASAKKCQECSVKVNGILNEYNCFMTAHMTITERGAFPKVIILDIDMHGGQP